ncbi:MAG: hypothetical protein J0G94_06395 [Sphingomonadales bacterium]|nr:hypothetical protein [Sphingomonadales bacterium]
MAGQPWFDMSQHRIFPPAGGPMHWSRIVDLPLAAMIALARLFTDQANAERIACVTVPLLTLLGLFLTIHAMIVHVTGQRVLAVMGSIMLAVSMGIGIQFLPMRVDHHGWQILLGAVASLLALRSLSRGVGEAALAGFVMALSLAVAIESLPLAVTIAAGYALLYLRGRTRTMDFALLITYLTSLTVSGTALLLVTRGLPGAITPWCDALSPAYLPAMAVTTTTLLLGERLVGSNAARRRLLALGLAGAAGALMFAASAPQCLAGPFSALDPIVYRYWYLNVGEGMPVWRQPIDVAILVPLPGALGLLGTSMALAYAPREQRDTWLMLLVLQVATFAVSLTVIRAMGLAHALALPGTAWLFMSAFSSAMRRAIPPTRVVLGLSCFALTPIGAEAVAYTLVVPASDAADEAAHARKWQIKYACTTQTTLKGLDALGPTVIFAPLDIGPDIVIYTRNSVIATGHHRNRDGMRAVISAFIAAPDEARAIVTGTGARYLAYCEGQREIGNYIKANPHGLMAQIERGRPPAWLEPVAMPRGEAIKVYRVIN